MQTHKNERETLIPMKIIPVDDNNLPVYLNLAQSYEGEFSAITLKKPDPTGRFALDTAIGGDVLGYLLLCDCLPIGLAAIRADRQAASFEVCEFYVVPSCRGGGLGRNFAITLFERHRGAWVIKQLPQAVGASGFWRRTLQVFTGGDFSEDRLEDPYWGPVVRQQFRSAPPTASQPTPSHPAASSASSASAA